MLLPCVPTEDDVELNMVTRKSRGRTKNDDDEDEVMLLLLLSFVLKTRRNLRIESKCKEETRFLVVEHFFLRRSVGDVGDVVGVALGSFSELSLVLLLLFCCDDDGIKKF